MTVAVEYNGATLSVRAGPGETNRLEFTRTSGELMIRDWAADISASGACVAQSANLVICSLTGVTKVEVNARDGDDTVLVDAAINLEVRGGDGADLLTGGDSRDSLFGNGGDDVLNGGDARDGLCGDDGNNTFINAEHDDIISDDDPADLTISSMTDNPDPVAIGGHVAYFVTVTNLGPDTSSGSLLTVSAPSSFQFVFVAGSSPECGDCYLTRLGSAVRSTPAVSRALSTRRV